MANESSKVESAPEVKEAPPEKPTPSELEQARQQNEELLMKLKYVQAEYENFRKQAARDMETVLRFANEALFARVLPVLDDFDAALANLGGDAAKGVRMVHDNLVKVLKEGGLQEIPAKGQKFDPYVHDCVQRVPDSGLQDGIVKEVVRKGYRLQDRILRPAQVIVVKNGGETNG